jgi:two-component system response regulator AlgR
MKILIVDDEPLARARLRALIDELGCCEIVADVSNGNEALSVAHAFQPEVILLDIRMPGMDGMEAAQQFALQHPAPAIIFTTAFSQHAVEAFEHHAVDYLLKPIRKERLEKALKRAYSFLQTQSSSMPIGTPKARTHISYHFRGELRLVPVNQIYYFSAEQKYVVVHWAEGEALISESLKELEQEFAGQFLRIHRSTLVAMGQIRSLSKEKNSRSYIHLKELDESLEVSRRHLQEVKKLLKDMRISEQ